MKKRAGIVESISDIFGKIRILIIVLIVFLVIGSLLFAILDSSSIVNGFVSTLLALAFLYEAESISSKAAQVFVSVFGAVIFWWVVWTLFDLISSEHFVELIKSRFIEWRVRHMKEHVIIAGGGRVGAEVAQRLKVQKVLSVVIDNNPKRIKELRQDGLRVIFGDATDALILQRANVKGARGLLLALPAAEKNLLVALLAKELCPSIVIHARADSDDYTPLLKRAGVSSTVIPEVAAADQLLLALLK